MNARGTTRYIPHAPDRILDAPEIVNDYCTYRFRAYKHQPYKQYFMC